MVDTCSGVLELKSARSAGIRRYAQPQPCRRCRRPTSRGSPHFPSLQFIDIGIRGTLGLGFIIQCFMPNKADRESVWVWLEANCQRIVRFEVRPTGQVLALSPAGFLIWRRLVGELVGGRVCGGFVSLAMPPP